MSLRNSSTNFSQSAALQLSVIYYRNNIHPEALFRDGIDNPFVQVFSIPRCLLSTVVFPGIQRGN